MQNDIYATTIKQMLKKLFKIDFEFFECHTTGDIANRFNSINELYQFISGAAITTLIDILTAIICGIVMVIQSVSLFIIVFIITIIQIVCVVVINKYIRKKTNEYIDSLAKVESILVEALSNIQQIIHVFQIRTQEHIADLQPDLFTDGPGYFFIIACKDFGK